MDKEKAIKVLHSARSSKEQLRTALAWALGAPQPPKGGAKEKSMFSQCKDVFMGCYESYTGLTYNFAAKDGVALSGIIKKIEAHLTPGPSPRGEGESVVNTFIALLQNLPEWYKKNAFSLPVINSKFNEIVASISKKNGTTNGNSAAREAVRNAFASGR